MPFTSLLSCEPGEKFYDGSCSSNSASVSNDETEVTYAPDYGLSNNVSWAAQWSNEHGVASIPSSALAYSVDQIAEMGALLNEEIASVAAEAGSPRLQVVTPPHFNVGVDVSPLYPSSYSCSSLGYQVDGPSVQSAPTQDELLAAHPLSFCSGPADGPPWVISGDTGIHPSATGYTQMASQVPAP